jgi:hypothetical protein
MLAALEKRLHAAVNEAVKPSVRVECGPTTGPASEDEHMVEVSVREFKATTPSNGEDVWAIREHARVSVTQTWPASGKTKNFKLPKKARGEVVEVEAPPGHPVSSGDDYFLEDRTLRFYRYPAEGKPGVIATLHGAPAKGYRESCPCRILVNLTVWAKKLDEADAVFNRSLNAILAAFVDLHKIRSPQDKSGVGFRLLKPMAVPDTIDRSREKLGQSLFYCTSARINVFGELELSVALGAEEPKARIKEIEFSKKIVKGAKGEYGI